MDKEEIKLLEREYEDSLSEFYKNQRHFYYAKVGAVIGFFFIAISSFFNDEFYKFFGTFGMTIFNGVAGMCIFFSIIAMLPSFKEDEKFKWHILELQRKKIEKLKK